MLPLFKEYLVSIETEGVYRGSVNTMPSENTLNIRERSLSQFSEWLADERDITDATAVTKRDVLAYIDACVADGYKMSTITKSKFASISAAYNRLHDDAVIDDNPVQSLTRSTVESKVRRGMDAAEIKAEHGDIDYLTKEQVYELAENAPDPTVRNELLIKLMFWTGIRVSEVVRINIGTDGTLDGPDSDIDPTQGVIHVFEKKSQATDPIRPVAYPRSELNPLLRDYVGHGRLRYKYADDTNRLFLGHKKPLTESGVGHLIDQAAENVGIQEVEREAMDGRKYKRVTPHLLRHSHAMHYHNEKDVSLDRIGDHLGHANQQTTEEFYAETTRDAIIDTFGE